MINQRVRWNKSFIKIYSLQVNFIGSNLDSCIILLFPYTLCSFLSPVIILYSIAYLLLNNYTLCCLESLYGVRSDKLFTNFAFASKKQLHLGPFVNVLYKILMPILLIYSLITIREMKWSRGE